jgi:CRISPR-associated endoribonuclease Cas6
MLTSIVALMEAEGPGTLPVTTGELMQGALFRRLSAIDAEATDRLHGAGRSVRRPYTISPLLYEHEEVHHREMRIVDGDRTWFRVTGLSESSSELLLEMTQRTQWWELATKGMKARFRVNHWKTLPSEHPWAGRITLDNLWQSAWQAMQRQPDRIWLDFQTPTGFDVSSSVWPNWSHLPLPELVFGSLLRKQQELAPELGEPPGGADEVESLAALAEYDVESRMMKFGGHQSLECGFMGTCEYAIRPDAPRPAVFWMHLLAGLAFYTGVGTKTSWGMGMTRRSRYGDFTYRGGV